MLPRVPAATTLRRLAASFRAVVVTGPRQAGKTTLVRAVFADKPYASLEDPDELAFARDDPRGFLGRFPDGAILDEVQRAPDLFSYLQGVLDEDQRRGRYILTGSRHFGLLSSIRQSLAGRAGVLHLLPFSLGELQAADLQPSSLDDLLWRGLYPSLHGESAVDPLLWHGNYITTYVERDVRGLLDVRDLPTFQRFVKLCAGHVGQLVNLSRLGSEVGISHPTARAWLDILEASYVVFRLTPYFGDFLKRVTKTPKLYFFDTGLAARLLGIRDPGQLVTHPMRGALFENWVLVELAKQRFGLGLESNTHFWRTAKGDEVDVVIDRGLEILPIECKSGATFLDAWVGPLRRWESLAGSRSEQPWIVYGGTGSYDRQGIAVVAWADLPRRILDGG